MFNKILRNLFDVYTFYDYDRGIFLSRGFTTTTNPEEATNHVILVWKLKYLYLYLINRFWAENQDIKFRVKRYFMPHVKIDASIKQSLMKKSIEKKK